MSWFADEVVTYEPEYFSNKQLLMLNFGQAEALTVEILEEEQAVIDQKLYPTKESTDGRTVVT